MSVRAGLVHPSLQETTLSEARKKMVQAMMAVSDIEEQKTLAAKILKPWP